MREIGVACLDGVPPGDVFGKGKGVFRACELIAEVTPFLGPVLIFVVSRETLAPRKADATVILAKRALVTETCMPPT
jgi:hypothetical protein